MVNFARINTSLQVITALPEYNNSGNDFPPIESGCLFNSGVRQAQDNVAKHGHGEDGGLRLGEVQRVAKDRAK